MGIMDGAKGKANDYLNSDQGKEKSGEFLDKAEQQANDRLGEGKEEHVSKARDTAEKRISSGGDNETDAEVSDDPQADPDAK